MWIVTRAACAAAANGAHPLQNVPDYYNKEEELHMNQFTKAVKSLAAKYNGPA